MTEIDFDPMLSLKVELMAQACKLTPEAWLAEVVEVEWDGFSKYLSDMGAYPRKPHLTTKPATTVQLKDSKP